MTKECCNIDEIKRLIPYLKLIKSEFPEILISIDTFNSDVAHEALLNGADWINDVTGGRKDRKILDVVAKFNCCLWTDLGYWYG